MLELFGHQILQKLLAPVCLVIVIWKKSPMFQITFPFLPIWFHATVLICKLDAGDDDPNQPHLQNHSRH